MLEISDLYRKYVKLSKEMDPLYYNVPNPKKVELVHSMHKEYKLFINFEFKGLIAFDPEIGILTLRAIYVSDSEVIIFLFPRGDYNKWGSWFEKIFRWKDGTLSQIGKMTFISPDYTISEYMLDEYRFIDAVSITHHNGNGMDLELENYHADGIFLYRKNKIFTLENILKNEIKRIFEMEIDVHYRPRRFNLDIPNGNDKLITIRLTDTNLEVKLSKLYKLDSELIDNLLENNDQEIYLPISKLDYSLECLDYLGAKYINWVVLKTFLKGFELLKINLYKLQTFN